MPPTTIAAIDAPRARRVRRDSLLGALWIDFPLVVVAVGGASTTFVGLGLEDPVASWLRWTWLFSSAFLVLVLALTWKSSGTTRRTAGLVLLAANLAANGAIAVAGRGAAIPHEHLRLSYELSILFLLGVFFLHMRGRQPSLVPLFFGPVLLFGVLLENGGIAAGLFAEMGGTFYVRPLAAPLATMLGWITVLYVAIHTTWRLREALPTVRRSPALSAIAVTVAALLLDLHVDPYATAIGMWVWDPTLPPTVFGVPAANWVAWTVALVPFSWVFFARETRLGLAPGEMGRREHVRFLFRATLPLCIASLGLFVLGLAVVEGGFAGPTIRLLLRPFS